MFRKGKFKTSASLKRPHFVCGIRQKTNKHLKRATNRAVRRQPLDSLGSGREYKRLIEVWDYNGDMSALHYYCKFHPGNPNPKTRRRSIRDFYLEDEKIFRIVRKAGRRYFRK